MRGMIMATLATVLVLPALPGPVQAAEPSKAACTCSAVLDGVISGVEADYAGFSHKVDAERREAYDRFKAAW